MTATQLLMSNPKIKATDAAAMMNCTVAQARRQLKEAAPWIKRSKAERLEFGAKEVSARQYGMRVITVAVPSSEYINLHKARLSKLKNKAQNLYNVVLQFEPTPKQCDLRVISLTDDELSVEVLKAINDGQIEQFYSKRHPLAQD